MEAISPLLVQTSICLLDTLAIIGEIKDSTYELNEYLVILWSCLLLCSSGEKQVQFTKKLLKVVEEGIHAPEGKKWFDKCFS